MGMIPVLLTREWRCSLNEAGANMAPLTCSSSTSGLSTIQLTDGFASGKKTMRPLSANVVR